MLWIGLSSVWAYDLVGSYSSCREVHIAIKDHTENTAEYALVILFFTHAAFSQPSERFFKREVLMLKFLCSVGTRVHVCMIFFFSERPFVHLSITLTKPHWEHRSVSKCCVLVTLTVMLFIHRGWYLLCMSLRCLECNGPRWECACGAQSAPKLHSENSAAVFPSEILSSSIKIILRCCCEQFNVGYVGMDSWTRGLFSCRCRDVNVNGFVSGCSWVERQ